MNKSLFGLLLGGVLALFLLGSLLFAPALHAEGVDPKAAFETLKGLAGTWEGQGESMPMTLTFEVASGGTIVMERLAAHSKYEMINIYHLVDGELQVVHYCSAGNQPMMKLDTAASKPGDLLFTFAGGTNFDPAKDSYINQVRIKIDGESLAAEWGSAKAGKNEGTMKLQVRRTGKAD